MNSFVLIGADRVLSAIKQRRDELESDIQLMIEEHVEEEMRLRFFNPFPAKNRDEAMGKLFNQGKLQQLERCYDSTFYHLDTLEFLCNAVTTMTGQRGSIYISSQDIRLIGKYLPVKY